MNGFSKLSNKKLLRLYEESKAQHESTMAGHISNAKMLIEKMFGSFKAGGEWIKQQHAVGRKQYGIVNVFGMTRHLWGYASPERSVHAEMDRQGPNSVIQGPSSNINSIAGYLFAKSKRALYKKGFLLDALYVNSVHDASYFEVKLQHLPLAMYVAERCAVDLTMSFCKKWFGWEMNLMPEVAFSFGPNLGEMYEVNGTETSFLDAVKNTIQYQNEHYGYNLDSKTLLKEAARGWRLVNGVRVAELSAMGDSLSKVPKSAMTDDTLALFFKKQ